MALEAKDHMGIFWNKLQDGSLMSEEGAKEARKPQIIASKFLNYDNLSSKKKTDTEANQIALRTEVVKNKSTEHTD